jgi:pimeloyl-ACP methyl ester carboxylesterase
MMADTYVLIHGAWHTGAELEAVANHMRRLGHTVHCPTIAGNRSGEDRSRVGLEQAISSIARYIETNQLSAIRLAGHSYGGMIISGIADRMPQRLARLIYINGFVPLDGECLNDMVPAHYIALFDALAAATPDNTVILPFDIWREAFINDADLALAQSSYAQLNPHPYRTFTDKITLRRPLAELAVGKSYLNCQQDIALPHGMPWHPRLSERLGLFRLVECPGSHEMLFSNPALLAQTIMNAGRD